MSEKRHYDVAILGGGLAGLSLARQLHLADPSKTVLLLDKRGSLPTPRQKVGESLVQVGGYYFGKVLDLEEHLWRNHYMKYNLRFYWKSEERDNSAFEDYSQSYIRNFSNIPCYQLDRNVLEAHLLELNEASGVFELGLGAAGIDVELSEDEAPHRLEWQVGDERFEATAGWVVDTTGRRRMLAKQQGLTRPPAFDHGASFLWVDGLVDIDKLTDQDARARNKQPSRRETGHLPIWLATNHFMGEGFWFWVIPLQGLTSLGLVYDNKCVDRKQVDTPEKLLEWVCKEFPLFARDLPKRKVLDRGFYKSHAHGCGQTIHHQRWAMSGEAGRFTDPLYSPGSDFIAVHNTLIIDAILTGDARDLQTKCALYEVVMQSLYESLLPTFGTSYDALGDAEAFSLKYTWELSVYFAFFVFPFINDLCTDRRFVLSYLKRFAQLGQINRQVQGMLSGYYQWKKAQKIGQAQPVYHDFTDLCPLKRAADTFLEVGPEIEEARRVLDDQLDNLRELARFVAAHVAGRFLGEDGAVRNRAFVEAIDLNALPTTPEDWRRLYAAHADCDETYAWNLHPETMDKFKFADEGVEGREAMSAG